MAHEPVTVLSFLETSVEEGASTVREVATQAGQNVRTFFQQAGSTIRTGQEEVGDTARSAVEEVGDTARVGAEEASETAQAPITAFVAITAGVLGLVAVDAVFNKGRGLKTITG